MVRNEDFVYAETESLDLLLHFSTIKALLLLLSQLQELLELVLLGNERGLLLRDLVFWDLEEELSAAETKGLQHLEDSLEVPVVKEGF